MTDIRKILHRLIFFVPLLFWMCSTGDSDKQDTQGKLFDLVDGEQSGIRFVNEVQDMKNFNILNYRNFYNGGGVAIGDLNNDGLEDIYFTSNLGANRLYINRGNWQFEDITENAGVSGKGTWTTGVAMVDINEDGHLDIYVCNSGDVRGGNLKNELFINDGALHFSDKAAQYGLDSEAFSIHASFFDYDVDGDLDCYLLNNSFTVPDPESFYKQSRGQIDSLGGDRLYRNDGTVFTDVTVDAGIHASDMGFGLGVSVGDLNDDMLPDIYISNDFWERDYLYINQGNGTFVDEIEHRIAMTSLNSMGSDIGDLNNDGAPEIITTDMLPPDNYRLKTMTQFEPFRMGTMKFDSIYHHQIMQNALQLNEGDGSFTEIAHMAGVSSSDWSWGALILDLDLDGWKDIFISNGIQRDIGDFDFVDVISNQQVVDQIVKNKEDVDFREFLPFLPTTKISNSVFINNHGLQFEDKSIETGLSEPSFSNGSAYGDLDNDGDLDLVVNNANMEAFIFRNQSSEQNLNTYLKIEFEGNQENPLGIGAKVIIKKQGLIQEAQHFLSRGFESSVAPGVIFGTGKTELIDTIQIIWSDKTMQLLTGVSTNQTIRVSYKDADLIWASDKEEYPTLFTENTHNLLSSNAAHIENVFNDFAQEPLMHRMLSTEGPQIVKGDLNGDTLEDFVLLAAADEENSLFIQNEDGSFRQLKNQSFENDKGLESTCGALFDFDVDGDLDLLVGHGGNEFGRGQSNFFMRLYENDGYGNLKINIPSTPQVAGNLSCIEPCDFDNDGDNDLFIGARSVPGHYGLIPSSYVLLNNAGSWINVTTEEFGRLGMVTAAKWSDVDHDNDQDLVVVGDWMSITVFENTGVELQRKGMVPNSHGWWSSMELSDLDNDGDDDFILGNWGLNSKFKASAPKPLKMYVKDFDRNGKVEQILEWYPPAEEAPFPFAIKDDMVKQVPQISRSIEKYADYGRSSYSDLFADEQRKGALELRTNYLESAILWNDSSSFRLEALPKEAQVSPVFSIVANDLNKDNYTDLILFGNFYGLKPEVGRLDANRGVVLLGSPSRQFQSMPRSLSGLQVDGEVRDAVLLLNKQGDTNLLIGRNNRSMLSYQLILN